VRWDSDHVVILSDEVRAVMQEVVRGNYLDRTHIALDFFDASINRVAAWVIGARATLKAILLALLEPLELLKSFESTDDFTSRLAALEHLNTLPFGAVWDYYCASEDVPDSMSALHAIKLYECDALASRSAAESS
jgi:L-rhamnose isomerase